MTMHGVIHQLLPLLLTFGMAASADSDPAVRIDVFTTAALGTSGEQWLRRRLPHAAITVHTIDGVKQVTELLGQDLPTDVRAAKRTALERMKQLDKDDYDRLRRSAESLLLAQQLGVARYPAVVFERRFVVYGVTDLPSACARFQQRTAEGIR